VDQGIDYDLYQVQPEPHEAIHALRQRIQSFRAVETCNQSNLCAQDVPLLAWTAVRGHQNPNHR